MVQCFTHTHTLSHVRTHARVSVSYTHLDVYKRQLELQTLSFSC